MNSNIFEKVLNEVSLDSRIPDGMFRIDDNNHMDVLREYFINRGADESLVIEYCNKVLEGKHPERQAYNAKGILVTFPTPEYKADAIKRGTHFEDDPTRRAQNIFQSSTPAATPQKPKETDDKKTSLPLSQTSATPEPTAEPTANPATSQPEPTVPAPQEPEATTVAPQQSQPTEPAPEPTELPPPAPKSPSETQANKTVIKKMLKGDDYMLEQVLEWFLYNAPESILSEIKKKL